MAFLVKRWAARRKIRELITQIEDEDWKLEAARSLSYEELRALIEDRDWLDQALRKVAEARTKEELLNSLRSIAGLSNKRLSYLRAMGAQIYRLISWFKKLIGFGARDN